MREDELIIYRGLGGRDRLLREMVRLMSGDLDGETAGETAELRAGEMAWESAERKSGTADLARLETRAGRRAAKKAGKGETDAARLGGCLSRLFEIAEVNGFSGNLWHCYLADRLANHENGFSQACEIGGKAEGSVNQAVLHDCEIIHKWFRLDIRKLMIEPAGLSKAAEATGISEAESVSEAEKVTGVGKMTEAISAGFSGLLALAADYRPAGHGRGNYSRTVGERICLLAAELAAAESAAGVRERLSAFYGEYGVGKFGLHKAFRVVNDGRGAVIVPITRMAPVRLSDLVGYEIPKQKLIDNTEAFLAGKAANNCLLYGDAGTGKSSSIKGLANEYYRRGLRIIEVYKHQCRDLNEVVAQIKNRNYKFILYMDDLSFEDFEVEYKYLKAVIEGGLEKKPDNVLIYATSNRRHLIREKFSDKEDRLDDLHKSDTVQEKLSLAARFGVTVYFGAPGRKEFWQIVKVLAARQGILLPEEELFAAADRWEMAHGGLSGRTAQQFVDYLAGRD